MIAESFHSLQSLSVSCFHVILGLPGPRFPSTCMSKAVLTAPLERSTCPYHRSLLSFRMRSSSSMPSHTNSSLDLVVTMSCGLTLQICLIIALSFRCRRWRFGFVSGQVWLAWSIALHGGHLGFTIGMILAIFDLQVTQMLPTKFRVNWSFGSGGEAKNRFSRWLP